MSVWLTARFAASAYVRLVRPSRPRVFSRTLSNTTTVSYSENPRIVSRPMTVAGETSKPTSEYTPAVMMMSFARAMSAASAIRRSK